jgi:hypothetical protein
MKGQNHSLWMIRHALLLVYYHQWQSFDYGDYLEEQEKNMALNKEEKNIGYLLGRLFGVFEEIQKEASGDLNATIKDRFFSAAMETPKTYIPRAGKIIKTSS